MIKVRRVYELVEPDDGRRFLVKRWWPRGMEMGPTTTRWLSRGSWRNGWGPDPIALG